MLGEKVVVHMEVSEGRRLALKIKDVLTEFA